MPEKLTFDNWKHISLLENINLDNVARVLLSWRDDILEDLLLRLSSELQIDYLMEGDFVNFLREKNAEHMIKYDYIIDNGLLLQTNVDVQLLRAMGMHLVPGGRLRSVFTSSVAKRDLLSISYGNNFERAICLAVREVEGDSFYTVEFSWFNQGITWLQSFYSFEVRRRLAYFLQRLDFNIEIDDTVSEIAALCRRYGINREYLTVMVELSTIHKQRVRYILESCKLL